MIASESEWATNNFILTAARKPCLHRLSIFFVWNLGEWHQSSPFYCFKVRVAFDLCMFVFANFLGVSCNANNSPIVSTRNHFDYLIWLTRLWTLSHSLLSVFLVSGLSIGTRSLLSALVVRFVCFCLFTFASIAVLYRSIGISPLCAGQISDNLLCLARHLSFSGRVQLSYVSITICSHRPDLGLVSEPIWLSLITFFSIDFCFN